MSQSFYTPTRNSGNIESVEHFTKNNYIINGCDLPGHENQQLQFIFLKSKKLKTDQKNMFGCAYCVTERQYEDWKVIPLIKALKAEENEKLHRFPELDAKIEANVLKAIKTTEELKYDDEINEFFDQLQQKLDDEIDKVKRDGVQLVDDIKVKGDEMKETYTNITNCDQIRQCFEESQTYDELHQKFCQIIESAYAKSQQNTDEIQKKTRLYTDKLATFRTDYSEKLSKKIIDGIKKISFEKKDSGQMVQSFVPSIQREDYLKRQGAGRRYTETKIEFEEPKLLDKYQKIFQNFQINRKQFATQLTIGQVQSKKLICQSISQILDNNKTYKFEIIIANYNKDTTFSLGIGDFSKRDQPLYDSTKFQKVFNPKADYKGLTFVEYGQDVSNLHGESLNLILKFNIGKSYCKLLTADKQSSNILKEIKKEELLSQGQQYCFYVLNQSQNFDFTLVKAEESSD